MKVDSRAAAAAELEQYWQTNTYGHAATIAQILDHLPNTLCAQPRRTDVQDEGHALPQDANEPRIAGGRPSANFRQSKQPATRCMHPDGHELRITAREALALEAPLDCPCCGARLWAAVPTAGDLILAARLDSSSALPDLSVDLTHLEQQVLGVLYRARYPMHARQLAALVWSDGTRTHDVRNVLYQLRRKLSGSGWAIPVPKARQGIRLVRVGTANAPSTPTADEADRAA